MMVDSEGIIDLTKIPDPGKSDLRKDGHDVTTSVEEGASFLVSSEIDPQYIDCTFDTIKFLVDRFNDEKAHEEGYKIIFRRVPNKRSWFDNEKSFSNKGRGYFISEDGNAITCKKCGMASHHHKDVEYRYCANCHEFLE